MDKLGAMKLSDFVENGEQKNLPKGKGPTSADLTDSTLSDEQRNAVIDNSITNSQGNTSNSYVKMD